MRVRPRLKHNVKNSTPNSFFLRMTLFLQKKKIEKQEKKDSKNIRSLSL